MPTIIVVATMLLAAALQHALLPQDMPKPRDDAEMRAIIAQQREQSKPQRGHVETAGRTRSLSGEGKALDGNPETAATVIGLLRVGLIGGYAIRRVKMFNARIHLDRYRRSYWLGTRYYALDNNYFLATRESCIYRLNATESADLMYEDGEPINDVVYQCQRYAQYCCGLDCCTDAEQFNNK